jgi:hypothetical protein
LEETIMPVPIRPIDDRDRGYAAKDSSYTMMDLDVLSKAFDSSGLPVKKADKFVQASDEDASVLFDLWKKSEVVKDAGDASEKQYSIPKDFSNDNIMRLKASNFITGDMSVIRFLPRAIGVIKTMVLAEENEFGRKATQKPYNLILAEMKRKFSGGPRLALGSAVIASALEVAPQDGLDLNEHIKTAQVGNIDMPSEKLEVLYRTPYLRSDRLVFQEGNSDKEYVVRVFDHMDGTYSAVAFNGRTGRGLTAQPKYYGRSLSQAESVASEAIRAKERKGYNRFSGGPATLAPGITPIEEPSASQRRTAPTRPATPPPVATKPKQTKPSPKPEPASYKLTEDDIRRILKEQTPYDLPPEDDI